MILEHAGPHALCFHCKTPIYPETLAILRQYRTQYGIDVFQCPSCNKEFKVDPRDFLDLCERLATGNWPAEHPPAIRGLNSLELTPYELIEAQFQTKKNTEFSLTSSEPKSTSNKLIKIVGVILIVVAAILWGAH